MIDLRGDLPMVGLFEGIGGLTTGIQMVLPNARLIAYAEYEPPDKKGKPSTQAPARLLAHRHPGIPNLGDVTTVDWAEWRGRVKVASGGFPCQDVSHAGLREGLSTGTRSGLWYEFARFIAEVRPDLVVIENVPGLRTARAGDKREIADDETTGDLESDDGTMGLGERDDRPVLRAFGAVQGDLAELGYASRWTSVRASDVGAPHRRERVFILAWPSTPDPDGGRGRRGTATP